jgi:Zn-dependent M16 (insulinase) family peptidase
MKPSSEHIPMPLSKFQSEKTIGFDWVRNWLWTCACQARSSGPTIGLSIVKTTLLALLPLFTLAAAPPDTPAAFTDITERTAAHGFRAVSVYLNDADQPFGARFIHQKTGFTLDLIQVQSVPQAFVWVNSFPVSDKGEPHTQEHLLMGKGNMGKAFAASQSMTLTENTAFTMQWRTCYPFNTKAGLPVFYDEFKLELQALLHPDYTDEEIRREVRNFGVSEDPATHRLRLEEKGTVYNEMVSSMNNPDWALFRQLGIDLYGPNHPLAYNSGGNPSGIREMLPADIRNFHDRHYFLANMGAIVSLPKGETVAVELAKLDQILNAVQPALVRRKAESEDALPRPAAAPAGSIQTVDFPFENEQQPSYIGLAWPAVRKLDSRSTLLLQLFMDSFAGDTSTDLYRLFVNSKTRRMDIGAQGVFSFLSQDQGDPVMIVFNEVAAANLTEAKVKEVRAIVTSELTRIAGLPDGSPELAEFNALVRGRLVDQKRQLSKLVNSPPGFGARSGSSTWMEQLYHLNRGAGTPACRAETHLGTCGFRLSVTQKPDIEAIGAILDQNKNIWRDLLPSWHLTDTEPYGIAAHPSAALLKKQLQESIERSAAEAKRLEAKYKITGEQDAIRRYQKDYDAESARLDAATSASADKFLAAPPLTLDDQLEYKEAKLADGIPVVSSVFDNMTSATTGIALRLDSVPEENLVLVSLLPALLTETGVIDNGKPIPYEEMEELLRKQILSLNAAFSANVRSNRVELVLRGAGNDLPESRRAIEWMRLALQHPDWRPENLPRIRDLVSQSVARLRATMQGSEESWVLNPVMAYWKQTNPLYLAASAFLTRAYNADRLRWMLKDVDAGEDRKAIAARILNMARQASDRPGMTALLDRLQSETGVIKDVAADLAQLLPDIPDGSLQADWRYLCTQISRDLLVTPEKTLDRLNALRNRLLATGNARVWMVGSRANMDQLQAPLSLLTGDLKAGRSAPVTYDSNRRIDQRLHDHQGDSATPRFVGLYDSNLTGGVMATIVPSASYDDTGREAQLDYLASRLFAGYGAHGVFTKTIGAGFAYSNGLRGNIHDGYAGYYAERMPEIPQTLHFVIDVIKKGPRDPKLVEYVIAMAFQESNASGSYEARAEAVANDLADGITPAKVRQFREAMLALRQSPGVADQIFQRMDKVYGQQLPGYGPKARENPAAVYYIIGNDKQFRAIDADVQVREDEHVYKLYPRDYWLIPK